MDSTPATAEPTGPEPLAVTAYSLAERYVGLGELAGGEDHPLIQWWLSLCGLGLHQHDETAWCSAFVQHPCFELGLPRSKSAAARSWLRVGEEIGLTEARVGWDVVILSRGEGPQPGPEVVEAPGHVGWFAGRRDSGGFADVLLLGGNQHSAVNVAPFPCTRVIGVRRLKCVEVPR